METDGGNFAKLMNLLGWLAGFCTGVGVGVTFTACYLK